MIEVQNLSKYYGSLAAVTGLSFSVARGACAAFLGPNGAGKTTTLRILTTLLLPSGGVAKVAGFDVESEAREVRRRIGYLPETPPLYSDLSVEEFITFAAELRGLAGKDRCLRVAQVIEQFELAEVRRRLCGELSRGFKQRVGLAQALVHDPEVVILDEPSNGLDPGQTLQFRRLIQGLVPKHTVLVSTHSLAEVTALCNQVIILSNGHKALERDWLNGADIGELEQVYWQSVGAERVEQNGVR